MEHNEETIGSRLKKLRLAKNLTLEEISDLTGIRKGNLSDYENDKVKPGSINLTKLAEFYAVSADWILTGKSTGQVNASETKASYSTEIKMVLPDPSNELVENLNLIGKTLAHGNPTTKGWLEGQIKWMAWKIKNW